MAASLCCAIALMLFEQQAHAATVGSNLPMVSRTTNAYYNLADAAEKRFTVNPATAAYTIKVDATSTPTYLDVWFGVNSNQTYSGGWVCDGTTCTRSFTITSGAQSIIRAVVIDGVGLGVTSSGELAFELATGSEFDTPEQHVAPTVVVDGATAAQTGETLDYALLFLAGQGDGLVDEATISVDGVVIKTCSFVPATGAGGCETTYTPINPGDYIINGSAHTVALGSFSDGLTLTAADADLDQTYFHSSTSTVAGDNCHDLEIMATDCETDWTLVNVLCSFPPHLVNTTVGFLWPSSCVDFEAMNAASAEIEGKAPFMEASSVINGIGAALAAPPATTCAMGINAPPPWSGQSLTIWDCNAIVDVFGATAWARTGRRWLTITIVISIGVTAFLFGRRVHKHFAA